MSDVPALNPQAGWDEFDPATEKKSKGGDIVFVSTKNTQPSPLTIRPVGPILKTESVYDATIKRSRKALPGEKPSIKYLINALDETGTIKVYQIGVSVACEIKDVYDDRETRDLYLDITSSGAGMNTEYKVRASKNKKLNGKVDESSLTLNDLNKIAASLIVDTSTTAAPAAPEMEMDDAFAA